MLLRCITKRSLWYRSNSPAVSIHPLLGVAITDDEYPARVAVKILHEAFDEFQKVFKEEALKGVTADTTLHVPKLDDMIKKYQDPKEADKLMKLESELQETTSILHKTMDEVKSKTVSGYCLNCLSG